MRVSNIKWLPGAAVFFAAVLWAMDGLLRTRLYELPPLTIVFAEHVIGLLIAVPLLLLFRKKIRPLTKEQKISITIVSALSGVIGTLLFTAALLRVNFDTFSVVILLQQLEPFFAISAAMWLLKEKVTVRFLGLAAIAIVGAYMLSFPDLVVHFDFGDRTLGAGLMAIGAAAAWGSSTALSKYSLKNTFWLHITALRFGLATIISGVGLLVFSSTNALGSVTGTQVQSLSLIALSTGFVALSIYYFGLQKIRASRATILELAFPLTAVFIGRFQFGNVLTGSQWLGAAIVTAVSFYLIKHEVRVRATTAPRKSPAIPDPDAAPAA